MQEAGEIIEKIKLDSGDNITSVDIKSLYINVPLRETIDIALRKLYEQEKPPDIVRKTMKLRFTPL